MGDQVGPAWQAVLELQVLQLLGQDGLAAAQVSLGSSACDRLWVQFWLWLGLQGGAGWQEVLQVRVGGGRLGQRSSEFNHQQMVLLSFLPPATRYLVPSGLGFAAGQTPDELLQAAELIKERRLADGVAQLQVEGAAGQDERRVAVEALQDVACRERGSPSLGCLVKI